MKKCKNCGMVQSDDNTVCLDCSSPLGSPMDKAENQKAEDAFKNKVHDMVEQSDEFYVPLRDKIVGYSCIFLAAIAILLITLANNQYGKLEPGRITQIGDVVLPENVQFTLPTERMNQLSDAVGCGLLAILFAVLSALALLLPRMMWLLETWKYRAHYGWDTPALPHIMKVRKIGAYICYGISVFFLIYGWRLFL